MLLTARRDLGDGYRATLWNPGQALSLAADQRLEQRIPIRRSSSGIDAPLARRNALIVKVKPSVATW